MSRTIFVALPACDLREQGEGNWGDGVAERAPDRACERKKSGNSYRAAHVNADSRVCDVLRSLGVCEGSSRCDSAVSQNSRTASYRDLVLLGNHSQKRWRWSESLATKGGARETFFSVAASVYGGGADGGSTGAEDRKAMLEMYAGDKPDAVDPKELRLAKYTTCQLSQEPLVAPVVCDDLGQLYNKEAFLKALISKAIPKGLGHLSRKSVFDVELSELDGASEGIKYGCPITSLPLNGKVRFVVVRNGDTKGGKGWVVSKKAVDELKEVVREVTGGYTEVIPLYPEGDELENAMKKIKERLASKKGKKRQIEEAENKTNGGAIKKAARTADVQKSSVPPQNTQLSQTTQVTKGSQSEVYKSIFLSKQSSGPASNTSSDFMVRGKRR